MKSSSQSVALWGRGEGGCLYLEIARVRHAGYR